MLANAVLMYLRFASILMNKVSLNYSVIYSGDCHLFLYIYTILYMKFLETRNQAGKQVIYYKYLLIILIEQPFCIFLLLKALK